MGGGEPSRRPQEQQGGPPAEGSASLQAFSPRTHLSVFSSPVPSSGLSLSVSTAILLGSPRGAGARGAEEEQPGSSPHQPRAGPAFALAHGQSALGLGLGCGGQGLGVTTETRRCHFVTGWHRTDPEAGVTALPLAGSVFLYHSNVPILLFLYLKSFPACDQILYTYKIFFLL